MRTPNPERLVKILLHSRGADPETSWAEDLGPHSGQTGARLVRLGSIPFLHAKPTYGDVIAVTPDESGMLAWDSQSRPYQEIVDELLVEDGGRWAMIVDYALAPGSTCTIDEAFAQLDRVAETDDIVVEGCWVKRERGTGRAYLAVPASFSVVDAMAWLKRARFAIDFLLVHPRHEG